MSQSLKVLESHLLTRHGQMLSVANDHIQDYSNDCDRIADTLNLIKVDDPESKALIVAIRSALFIISEHASDLSAEIIVQLISRPAVEKSNHE
ncbi:hypothetical protein [Psychrobacter sp. JCM 18900]|uniref:hypothetical protein n=1 Tax=Psychrobacter sp. JCM 18900 TaxID=1298608 RepID=UPI001918EF16|nr:hypothetical protein [Psychrobacter sp. JCM 18900]